MSHFDELLKKEPYRSIFDDGSAYKITPSGIERGHVEYDKRLDRNPDEEPSVCATNLLSDAADAIERLQAEAEHWKQAWATLYDVYANGKGKK